MKLLLLSDTQTDRNNIRECEIMLDALLRAARLHQPDCIVHCGDLKEQYSPVDVFVPKFWVRAVRLIKKAGFRFIALKGNHDRISQSVDSRDWLSILAAAGAEVVNKPTVKTVGDGEMALLPYTPNKQEELEWGNQLFQQTRAKPRVLIFHTEIKGAALNAAGMQGHGYGLDDLHGDHYHACFGGHFHLHQQLARHAWYVGSPFCHSWSECNASKGLLLAEVASSQVRIEQLPLPIPDWYDVEYLEANQLRPEPGAYIRSKVTVSSKKITDRIRAEEQRLRKQYGNKVRLFVVPQLADKEQPEVPLLDGGTDAEKVAQYVTRTCPATARFTVPVVTGYLTSRLAQASPPAPSLSQIEAIRVWGTNVLPFPQVELELNQKGLVLIRGVNRDWHKRSNGSGKSSALSLAPIALFGRTLKGQTHDAWASEFTSEKAVAGICFHDVRGRTVEVTRTRRPHGLFLSIDGVDVSAGLTGTTKDGTQGQIEELCGHSFQTFSNAVYLDSAASNGFLNGAQKARMDLIAKLVNLQRFEVALKAVTQDIAKSATAISENAAALERLSAERDQLESELSALEQQVETGWAKKAANAEAKVTGLVKQLAAVAGVEQTYRELQEELDDSEAAYKRLQQRCWELAATVESTQTEYHKLQKLVQQGRCGYCGQKTGQGVTTTMQGCQQKLAGLRDKLEQAKQRSQSAAQQSIKLNKRVQGYRQHKQELEQELWTARNLFKQASEGAKAESTRNQKLERRQAELNLRLKQLYRGLRAIEKVLQRLNVDAEMLEYAKQAFSRKGMPLLLCQELVPLLNRAAEDYAELLFDGLQKIRFDVEGDELTAQVVNVAGSETIHGQSTGESAMAGLITALALREASPKTNLLILDEPAHGLDEAGARQFAEGLLRLKQRFDTILVCTHSAAIHSVLEGEAEVWTVVKRHGRSRLVTKSAAT